MNTLRVPMIIKSLMPMLLISTLVMAPGHAESAQIGSKATASTGASADRAANSSNRARSVISNRNALIAGPRALTRKGSPKLVIKKIEFPLRPGFGRPVKETKKVTPRRENRGWRHWLLFKWLRDYDEDEEE